MICTSSTVSAEEPLYDAQGRRDPFVPLISSGGHGGSGLAGIESVNDVDVQGVVYDPGGDSVAIINGAMLRVGEEFSNVKIKEIRQDGVLFEINGTEEFKPLYSDTSAEQQT
ncbi:MAG: hypothetical protein MOGMAGMI_01296 [Candidatus Omnitrophica bacterium]|nr:hypothetical protein [Candidatus Omnitrophota bacterium]